MTPIVHLQMYSHTYTRPRSRATQVNWRWNFWKPLQLGEFSFVCSIVELESRTRNWFSEIKLRWIYHNNKNQYYIILCYIIENPSTWVAWISIPYTRGLLELHGVWLHSLMKRWKCNEVLHVCRLIWLLKWHQRFQINVLWSNWNRFIMNLYKGFVFNKVPSSMMDEIT